MFSSGSDRSLGQGGFSLGGAQPMQRAHQAEKRLSASSGARPDIIPSAAATPPLHKVPRPVQVDPI